VWRERDPIETFKNRLIERGELSDEEFDALHDEVEEMVADAVEFARDAPRIRPRKRPTRTCSPSRRRRSNGTLTVRVQTAERSEVITNEHGNRIRYGNGDGRNRDDDRSRGYLLRAS